MMKKIKKRIAEKAKQNDAMINFVDFDQIGQ